MRFKIMFGLIKKMFISLLTATVSVSNQCMLFINHPTLNNLHPNKYSQELS